MTDKEAVIDLLKQQQQRTAVADKVAAIQEWTGAAQEILDDVQQWLAAAISEGLLNVRSVEEDAEEDRLGAYRVPGVTIQSPTGRLIQVTPRARFVTGRTGRIDFDCPPQRFMLLRDDEGRWEFQPTPRTEWKALAWSEDAFWTILKHLLQ